MKSRQTVRGSIIMFWRVFLNFLRPFLFKAIYWLTIEFHRRKICLPIGSEDLCPNQPMGFWGLFSQRHLLSLRSESASSQYLVIIPSGNKQKKYVKTIPNYIASLHWLVATESNFKLILKLFEYFIYAHIFRKYHLWCVTKLWSIAWHVFSATSSFT